DLLTVRAVELLRAAPVVLYAGTYLDEDVLAHCGAGAELIDTQGLDLDRIIEHLTHAHRRGLDAVRLCSGDPSVYSALTEQTRRLDAAGVPWDVTPGVPAYAAAAAALGTELTVPGGVQTVVLTRTRARSTPMPDTESLQKVAGLRASLVLHLAITRIRELAEELAAEYGADCPAVVVAHASRPDQVVLRGTLATIADQVEAHRLRRYAGIQVRAELDRGAAAACGLASHLYDPRRIREP